MFKAKYVVAGLLLYLVLLLSNIPASQVIGRLNLPNNIALGSVSGTLWQGKVQSLQLKQHGVTLNNLKWEVNPWELLTGSVVAKINAGSVRDADQVSIMGIVRQGFSSTTFEKGTVYVPAQLIADSAHLPLPVNAKGRAKLDVQLLNLSQMQCVSMAGKLQWLNAGVQGLQQMIDLGNLSTNISCKDNSFTAKFTPDNVLKLDGEAQFDLMGKFSINVTAQPDPGLPRDVRDAFELIGKPIGNGRYKVEL